MKKYCVKCGKKFDVVGREVICPACKQAAAEESKRAAVLAAKRKSWTGESVPVRISGRASALIRKYGAAKGMPFAAALDALLQSTAFFKNLGQDWDEVTPYKSHRRDNHATEDKQGKTAGKPQVASKAASKSSSKSSSKAKK